MILLTSSVRHFITSTNFELIDSQIAIIRMDVVLVNIVYTNSNTSFLVSIPTFVDQTTQGFSNPFDLKITSTDALILCTINSLESFQSFSYIASSLNPNAL